MSNLFYATKKANQFFAATHQKAMDEENWCSRLDVREHLHAQTLVYYHVFNLCGTMSIHCAVKLGIPDTIHQLGGGSRPIVLAELTAALPEPIHPSKLPSLSRLMRLLVQLDFLSMHGDDGYVLTPFSKLLLKSNPAGMSDFYLGMLHPKFWSPWGCMSEWFKGDDASAYEMAYGKNAWEVFRDDPVLGSMFNDAMASDSRSVMDVVVNECGDVFGGIRSLVDVGGGTGTAAAVIAKAFPDVKCTVLDLAHVVEAATAGKAADGNPDVDVEFVAGDMFLQIPSADAFFLKYVLHDWDDETCVKILERCKESLPSNGGKLIVLDMVLKSGMDADPKVLEVQLLMDAMMMMAQQGKERDEGEWRRMFMQAGFSDFKIKYTVGIRSLMEIRP